MLNWRTPQAEDIGLMYQYMEKTGAISSDTSPVNIFLLKEKYNIRIAEQDGFLFRKYSGTSMPGRNGIAFPVGDGDISHAVELAVKDRRERNREPSFIFLTEEQSKIIEETGGFEMCTDRGNSDYLYTADHLAELTGSENRKKRNRVNRFERLYPDMRMQVSTSFEEKFCVDLLKVEERWFEDQESREDSAFVERQEIYDACRYWDALGLIGAVVYSEDDTPVAMTLASKISEGAFDIHFEKCYGEYAQAGGFSYINKHFADHLRKEFGAKWINREEDIGLEGLRRAKMSYNPDLLLTKYHTCGYKENGTC